MASAMASSGNGASSTGVVEGDARARQDSLAGTIAKHYNELQETGIELRKESRIFHLRNFNNWIKSVLLGDFIDELRKTDHARRIHALDLCCGKGGDLRKWMIGRVAKVVFTDIAGTSLEQCKSRYDEMSTKQQRGRNAPGLFDAEFHCADSTKDRLKNMYKEANIAFDITSCQFSFHYSFESLPQAEMMLRNACECLKPGGFFIGTTPDSLELVKRLRASPDMSFGNNVYNVKFLSDNKHDLPLFGCKYDFHLEGVVDCPEFLVYFPALEELAKKFNMKLVYKKTFAEFFKEKYQCRQHRTLLEKMNALEPYPPERGVSAASDDPASYAHASQKLEELSGPNPSGRMATLTLEEWQAATVYLVFAFQKMADNKWMESSRPSSERQKPHPEPAAASCSPKSEALSETAVNETAVNETAVNETAVNETAVNESSPKKQKTAS